MRRYQLAQRLRSKSLSSTPPSIQSEDFSPSLANLASSIVYRSPLPSASGLPIFILDSAAFPDANDVEYSTLLPYVLARLPGEDELIGGQGYEVVFFAGGEGDGATTVKKEQPGSIWFMQAYNVLSRATRKRLQKLYIVHERRWVRILVEMFSTIVSPKFRKKIVHASTLTGLALHIPSEDLLIPPSAYLQDRQKITEIYVPYASGRRAFGAQEPFPISPNGEQRLPRVLRETSSFLLLKVNVTDEGIFRVSAHKRLLDVLREAYDRGQKFILWKEGSCSLPLQEPAASQYDSQEIAHKEGYGIHLAAGLIKLWYSKLREPLFPPSTYQQLKSIAGDGDAISVESLGHMISSDSIWSTLPAKSRIILTKHLLPLLSLIAQHQEQNKMTPPNLAACIAGSLICGTDPMRDFAITGSVCRFLAAAISCWDSGLRESCGVTADMFSQALQPPAKAEDYEDPLNESQVAPTRKFNKPDSSDSLRHEITLEDNEFDGLDDARPPLPPRRPVGLEPWQPDPLSSGPRPSEPLSSEPLSSEPFVYGPHSSEPLSSKPLPSQTLRSEDSRMPDGRGSVDDNAVKRKPAPPLAIPPRYSTTGVDGNRESLDGARDLPSYSTTDDMRSA
ncbi:MAG: hypothetical protein M1827_002856 [Pycnora praestabilis]|nr:MAG: hypothetical protein M1827_002856 [Pycnora praestabilis]